MKPEIWSDEKIMGVSRDARCLFIGMFNFADDNGVLVNSPKEMKARIFPGDDDTDVPAWLEELIQAGLIIAYEVDGHKYVVVKTLRAHQVIDKPRKSNLPPPPAIEINRNQLKSTEILNGRKGREGKEGKEGKVGVKKSAALSPAAPVYICESFEISPGHFADLLKTYPQFPEKYLLIEFFPRMRDWCLDHREDAKHRSKFNGGGRLKNVRTCFRNWLKTEDQGKAAAYRPRKTEPTNQDPPGYATVFDPTCNACGGSGRDRDGPCGCGKLEPLLMPDPQCHFCGGGGLSKTGPCSCLRQEKYCDPNKHESKTTR